MLTALDLEAVPVVGALGTDRTTTGVGRPGHRADALCA